MLGHDAGPDLYKLAELVIRFGLEPDNGYSEGLVERKISHESKGLRGDNYP